MFLYYRVWILYDTGDRKELKDRQLQVRKDELDLVDYWRCGFIGPVFRRK